MTSDDSVSFDEFERWERAARARATVPVPCLAAGADVHAFAPESFSAANGITVAAALIAWDYSLQEQS